jgi:hypothetical protein
VADDRSEDAGRAAVRERLPLEVDPQVRPDRSLVQQIALLDQRAEIADEIVPLSVGQLIPVVTEGTAADLAVIHRIANQPADDAALHLGFGGPGRILAPQRRFQRLSALNQLRHRAVEMRGVIRVGRLIAPQRPTQHRRHQ